MIQEVLTTVGRHHKTSPRVLHIDISIDTQICEAGRQKLAFKLPELEI